MCVNIPSMDHTHLFVSHRHYIKSLNNTLQREERWG